MNPLLNNPIADMYGPYFLVFYGCVIAVTLGVCWRLVQDSTKNQPLPLIPTEPDPYTIAYLRSQAAGVGQLALFNLILQGYLQLNEKSISQVPNHPDISHLQPVEEAVFNKFAVPDTAATSLWWATQSVQSYCNLYEEKLHNQQLLYSPEQHARAINIALIGVTIIFSVGSYKLLIALSKGYNNVGFLILMAVFSIIWLFALVNRKSHLSYLGYRYLQQLQDTFSQLKSQAKSHTSEPLDYKLLVALFGIETLAGTAYNAYHQAFFPPRASTNYSSSSSSGSSCGSSCSSSSCGSSCGGGCGGCGGGGD